MRVSVRQSDINKGKIFNPHSCPVALALSRSLACDESKVYATPVLIEIQQNNIRHGFSWTGFPTPVEVGNWMKRFDDGLEVEPFAFDAPIVAMKAVLDG